MNVAGDPIIICPVRFREGWRIIEDTASFLLPNATTRSFVTETTVKDAIREEIGSIDVVQVEYDRQGHTIDFGGLEIQAVYISGNVRNPFRAYMADPESAYGQPWIAGDYPRPDWLSSVKRLVRQLIVKGSVFNAWEKRMAIAVQRQFYQEHLSQLRGVREVPSAEADVGWFLYDLKLRGETGRYELQLEQEVYMTFADMSSRFSTIEVGDIEDFKAVLTKKVCQKLGIKLPGISPKK